MHPRARDLTGLRVGYLTAVSYQGSDGRDSIWLLRCDCGKEITMPASEYTKQHQRGVLASCGCKKRESIGRKNTKHGMSKHPAFAVWRSLIDRCTLPSHQAWKNYGGRGITVCERWRTSFENFWADMGETYQPGLTLDRRDNNGNYEPGNCRWVSARQQCRNKRGNRFIETPWGTLTVAEAAQKANIGVTTLHYRLNACVAQDRLFDKPDIRNRFMT